ncbi:hypothetical protein RHOSPDRAFT_8870, partial [Rhodotorula sp. JG-1b]
EVSILRHLLSQTSFRRGKRGDWYDRLALLQGSKKEKKDAMLRARREEALALCEKGLADPYTHLSALHSFSKGERIDVPTIGRKSVWRASDGEEVSVEGLCLEQYQREGWKGFHSENGVLTMIFALIFWDILFAPVDGVFETPFQTAPLDLATDAFSIVGIRWDRYTQEDLLEIVECIGPQALAAILTVFVEEYGHRTGGIPDLCLWNPETSRALFSE